MRFPRVIYGFRPASGDADERWRVTVLFHSDTAHQRQLWEQTDETHDVGFS